MSISRNTARKDDHADFTDLLDEGGLAMRFVFVRGNVGGDGGANDGGWGQVGYVGKLLIGKYDQCGCSFVPRRVRLRLSASFLVKYCFIIFWHSRPILHLYQIVKLEL